MKIAAWLGTIVFLLGLILFILLNVPGPSGLAALFGIYVMVASLPFYVVAGFLVSFLPLRINHASTRN